MSVGKVFWLIVLAAALVLMVRCSRDPHRTALPFGSTDLSSVQPQLARLPLHERELVEAYVKRSGGDVLLPSMADPDAPLTARTFGQAISLERDWQVKVQQADARSAELRQVRLARLAPLLALVDADVAKAEILTRNEYQARKDPGFLQRPYRVDTNPVFVSRIRVHNRGSATVVALTGSLHVRDREAVLPMDLCWIDLGSQRALAAGASIEFDCGNANRDASQQQRDFVSNPPGRFTVEWEPHHIKLASGRELDAGL